MRTKLIILYLCCLHAIFQSHISLVHAERTSRDTLPNHDRAETTPCPVEALPSNCHVKSTSERRNRAPECYILSAPRCQPCRVEPSINIILYFPVNDGMSDSSDYDMMGTPEEKHNMRRMYKHTDSEWSVYAACIPLPRGARPEPPLWYPCLLLVFVMPVKSSEQVFPFIQQATGNLICANLCELFSYPCHSLYDYIRPAKAERAVTFLYEPLLSIYEQFHLINAVYTVPMNLSTRILHCCDELYHCINHSDCIFYTCRNQPLIKYRYKLITMNPCLYICQAIPLGHADTMFKHEIDHACVDMLIIRISDLTYDVSLNVFQHMVYKWPQGKERTRRNMDPTKRCTCFKLRQASVPTRYNRIHKVGCMCRRVQPYIMTYSVEIDMTLFYCILAYGHPNRFCSIWKFKICQLYIYIIPIFVYVYDLFEGSHCYISVIISHQMDRTTIYIPDTYVIKCQNCIVCICPLVTQNLTATKHNPCGNMECYSIILFRERNVVGTICRCYLIVSNCCLIYIHFMYRILYRTPMENHHGKTIRHTDHHGQIKPGATNLRVKTQLTMIPSATPKHTSNRHRRMDPDGDITSRSSRSKYVRGCAIYMIYYVPSKPYCGYLVLCHQILDRNLKYTGNIVNFCAPSAQVNIFLMVNRYGPTVMILSFLMKYSCLSVNKI